MAEKANNSGAADVAGATDKQLELITQLYTEVPLFTRQYNEEQLAELSKDAAGKHIEQLLDFKKQVQALNNGASGARFDKIAFAMLYKLRYNVTAQGHIPPAFSEAALHEELLAEYKLYKGTEAHVKQFIEEEAGK